ncbi:MAG: OmpA family protein [Prevotellaceae bacterium]|nr:OmpA family protein [Prevotellaceae bacterium]
MKKILLLLTFAIMIGEIANAQAQNDTAASRQYLVSKAGQNWFVSLSGGANIYFGEFDKHGALDKRVSYVGKLSVGKWITPSVGFRAQFDFAGMRGFLNPYSTQFTITDIALNHIHGDRDADGYYKEKFNYFNSHLDLLFSIFKYKENRFYQLIPYLGVGYAFRFGYGEDGIHEGEYSVNVGLINRFRLSKSVDIDVELGGMFVNQRFDGVTRGQMLEGGLTATIGLNFKLGKTKTFKHPEKAIDCDYSTYEKQIADVKNNCTSDTKKLSDDLTAAKQKLADLEKQLNAKSEAKPTVEEHKIIVENFESILFETGSSVIKGESLQKLNRSIEILKKHPDVNIKLSGHTDSQGSVEYNQQLSKQRAESVKKYLQEKGITAKIETVGYGEEHSVATNKTTKGRAKNRRTEIEIN